MPKFSSSFMRNAARPTGHTGKRHKLNGKKYKPRQHRKPIRHGVSLFAVHDGFDQRIRQRDRTIARTGVLVRDDLTPHERKEGGRTDFASVLFRHAPAFRTRVLLFTPDIPSRS
jgi:hypothetical protein